MDTPAPLNAAKLKKRRPKWTPPAHVDGRVQASRYDPSKGQKDRRRGVRLKGGRVRLGQKRASRQAGKSGRRG